MGSILEIMSKALRGTRHVKMNKTNILLLGGFMSNVRDRL